MVSGPCDADDGDASRSQFLVQGSPEVGQGALVPLQPQGASLELQFLTLNATLTRKHHEPLQLGEVHPSENGMVKVITISFKGFDQPREQLLTLLIPQLQDMPEGVHDGIDAAQPVKISLPVSARALSH
jgi:hypothetical protein